MAVREAEPVGSLSEVKEAGLDREDLLGMYRNMLITRGVEERGHILYRQGKIPGSFYTGRGNEGASVAIATAMGPDDVGTPLHRDMGVHITRGVEPWRIFAQYMGRADGPTKGRDGNVHMADSRRCSPSPRAPRSPSASVRRSASPWAGSAKAQPRAATRTRR
jgi:pyruvate dehydrogenase E1 component alpha subunit